MVIVDTKKPVNIPCPICKVEKTILVEDAQNKIEYTCESCGQNITVDGSQITQQLEEIKEKIRQQIRKSSKKFKLR